MHPPVRHQTAGIIPEPPEIEMEPIRIECPLRRGPQPHIIIHPCGRRAVRRLADAWQPVQVRPPPHQAHLPQLARPDRSEEHTSELQSLAYLVCRLLLEKKKKHES